MISHFHVSDKCFGPEKGQAATPFTGIMYRPYTGTILQDAGSEEKWVRLHETNGGPFLSIFEYFSQLVVIFFRSLLARLEYLYYAKTGNFNHFWRDIIRTKWKLYSAGKRKQSF